tara:strand:- start:248 stop:631 length:384 start_codon:yes stop_codon:yes gene_type:complete
MIKEICTSNELLTLDNDGVVYLRFPDKTTHDINSIKEHLAGVEALDDQGSGVLLLVHFSNLVGMDKASRGFVNNEKIVLAHKACGMFVTSPLAKLIANFFLGINRPNFVISSFTDENSPKEWLLKQK